MNEQLRRIIAEEIQLDPSEVTEQTGSATCESWDSLAQVVMISRIAAEMGVEIPFDKMMEIRCAGDFQALVEG